MELGEIKQTIDLVALVESAGVELERSGSRHIGLCPFHADKTPSFFVFPDGHFKCFGCQEHGDPIDFVQKFHGVDFKGALRILGIEQGPVTPKKRQEIKKLQHQRKLIKAFREWEARASAEIGMLCRCCRIVLAAIKTEADLVKYGDRYHDLSSYAYHLDILINYDDETKFGLYNAGYYE